MRHYHRPHWKQKKYSRAEFRTEEGEGLVIVVCRAAVRTVVLQTLERRDRTYTIRVQIIGADLHGYPSRSPTAANVPVYVNLPCVSLLSSNVLGKIRSAHLGKASNEANIERGAGMFYSPPPPGEVCA